MNSIPISAMTTESWRQVKEIFQAAMDLSAAERIVFLNSQTADAEIKSEVAAMLEAHDEAGDFIRAPAFEITSFVENKFENVGRQIGAYRIIREIGRGGMGAVYLAERSDGQFEKQVALKLIKRGLDTDEIISRFRRERQILAALEHPNITRLLDGGATDEGLPYLVMDYVEGTSLIRFCDERRFSIDERLQLFLRICHAVSYAHQNLIIHRDLKPSNVLVTENGEPKLLDFGIAKLTTPEANVQTFDGATARVMTPEYAAPEQILGLPVTTATDVYSLGVVLYELLTGHRPYQMKNRRADELTKIITDTEPRPPSAVLSAERGMRNAELKNDFQPNDKNRTNQNKHKTTPHSAFRIPRSGDLDNIVLAAMRKEAARRYSSVEQFAGDIRRYLDGQPVAARPLTFSYRAEKFVKRNKILVGAGASLALSLIGGIAATTRQTRIAREQRDKAEKTNKFLQKMLNSPDPREQGKDVKVIEILELAAQNIEKDFAGEPEIVADLRTTIGLTFLNLGQLDSAESHLENALENRLAIFGREHASTAISLNNYGKLLQAKGDLREAEKMFRQSLAILRRSSGVDELEFASVLGNLGFLLLLEGNYAEAIKIHREELKILRGLLGANHPETARTLGSLANIYNSLDDKRTAEPMLREALAVTRKFYGDRHPDTASAMLHLGITILKYKTDEAASLFRRSLELRREFYGDEHTETAWAMYYLGEAFLHQGEHERAAECAKKVTAQRGQSIPETHPIIHSTLLLLGRVLLGTNLPAEAEPYLRESLKLREMTLPGDHWLLASAKSLLGECLEKLGQIKRAEPLLKDSYKSLNEKLGAEHGQTRTAKIRLEKLTARKDFFV